MRVRAIVLGVFLPGFLWAFGFEAVVFGGAGIDMPGIPPPMPGKPPIPGARNKCE